MHLWMVICPIIVVLTACQPDDSNGNQPDVCQRAMTVYRDALQEAIELAPACQTDADCILFSADLLSCPFFQVQSCPQVVHRETAAKFDSGEVKKRICEAAGNGPEACSVDYSCAADGLSTPVCQAGQCVGQ